MSRLNNIKASLIESFQQADLSTAPYHHWSLNNVLPAKIADAFADFDVETPEDVDYSEGTRASNNDIRGHFGPERLQTCPLCLELSAAFQDETVIHAIEKTCDVDLRGTYLRIEYAQDREGFWLEPHTDLGVKKFTMLIYLSDDEEAYKWGTSIYADKDTFLYNANCGRNLALVFIPSDNTWHGYEARDIKGIRKTLIVNYVTEEWRSKHELSFPDRPIGS